MGENRGRRSGAWGAGHAGYHRFQAQPCPVQTFPPPQQHLIPVLQVRDRLREDPTVMKLEKVRVEIGTWV